MNVDRLAVLAGLVAAVDPELAREALGSVGHALRERVEAEPSETALGVVLLAGIAFFQAEREHNPKVNSLGDALTFVSSRLAASSTDVSAVTETGKALGALLSTYGPAVAARALDRPGARAPRTGADGEGTEG